MLYTDFFFYVVIFLLEEHTCDVTGHNQPLGNHRTSDGHVAEYHSLLTPSVFWAKHMSPGTPCVFRGAAKSFPAVQKWTHKYLLEMFGGLEVKLEHKFEKQKTPEGDLGVGRDTIKSFLGSYLEKHKYVVSQLPDPMAEDVLVLPFLTCGSFSKRLLEANLWFSSGGTKSLLHKDADNAINCLLNGTKDWILIHPNYTEYVPTVVNGDNRSGFALIDVNKVNLVKYPSFNKVHYNHVHMEKGDCLFLPKSYWHQVNSFGTPNIAVTQLYSRLSSFNDTGCEEDLTYVPLSESGMIWTYPGYGTQTLGNMDPYQLQEDILEIFEKFQLKKLWPEYLEHFFMVDESQEEMREMSLGLVSIFDAKERGFVTLEEVQSASLKQLKDAVLLMDLDPANTQQYEHHLFHAERVRDVLLDSVVNNELRRDDVVQAYKKMGGSAKMGHAVFDLLSSDENVISKEGLLKRLPIVMEVYRKKQRKMKSRLFYDGQLVDGDFQTDKKELWESDHTAIQDDYPDHEPVYQPSDRDEDVEEPSHVEMNDDVQAYDEDDDLVEDGDFIDGFPEDNHEPIYQPDDANEDYDDSSFATEFLDLNKIPHGNQRDEL